MWKYQVPIFEALTQYDIRSREMTTIIDGIPNCVAYAWVKFRGVFNFTCTYAFWKAMKHEQSDCERY